jgi:hypothetical protein
LKETNALSEQIQSLLEKGVIAQAQPVQGEFISNVFLREKKDPGKYRMILNLTDLNKFVTYRKFKMDTFETALTLLTPNCYMASLDYTDTYYSLTIRSGDRKFLRFRKENSILCTGYLDDSLYVSRDP